MCKLIIALLWLIILKIRYGNPATLLLKDKREPCGQGVPFTRPTLKETEEIVPDRFSIRVTSSPGSRDEVRQLCTNLGGDLIQYTLTKNFKGVNYQTPILNSIQRETKYWTGISKTTTGYVQLNGPVFDPFSQDTLYDKVLPPLSGNCISISSRTSAYQEEDCSIQLYGVCEIGEA